MSFRVDYTPIKLNPDWIPSNVVNEFNPKKGALTIENQRPREVVECCIISPTYQSKIVDSYADVSKRQKGRLDLYNIEKVRHERAIIQNQNRGDHTLFGRGTKAPKDPSVKVYATASEYNLPGLIQIKTTPSLKDAIKARTEPVKSCSRRKEKNRKLDLFKYEAFFGLKNTLQFLWEVFNLKSFDNKGTDVICTVDIDNEDDDPDTNNAFWNGEQMYFGMGDQKVFNYFTRDLDIAAHEFGHAVIQATCDLEYVGESGAINEHYADVIGIMVKQYFGGVSTRYTFEAAFDSKARKPQAADNANFKIGEEVLIDVVKGVNISLRDMENPGKAFKNHPVLGDDEQPDNFGDYVKLPSNVDNGGVHKYSGFLNRAFVITAKLLGGYSWETAGRIWFDALKQLKPTSGFQDLMNATIAVAKEGKEKDALRKAWTVVGLLK